MAVIKHEADFAEFVNAYCAGWIARRERGEVDGDRFAEALMEAYDALSQLRGAVEALRGVLSGRVIRDEAEDGTPILLDLSTDPATPISLDRPGGQCAAPPRKAAR